MSPDGSTRPPPEEKLLKLIRAKSPRPIASSSVAQPLTSPGRGVSAFDVMARTQQLPWQKVVVACLGTILMIEAVLLVLQLARPAPEIIAPILPNSSSEEPSVQAQPTPDVPSIAQSAARPLFSTPTDNSSAESPVHPKGGPSAAAKQLANAA